MTTSFKISLKWDSFAFIHDIKTKGYDVIGVNRFPPKGDNSVPTILLSSLPKVQQESATKATNEVGKSWQKLSAFLVLCYTYFGNLQVLGAFFSITADLHALGFVRSGTYIPWPSIKLSSFLKTFRRWELTISLTATHLYKALKASDLICFRLLRSLIGFKQAHGKMWCIIG